jgi:hypothetical protein
MFQSAARMWQTGKASVRWGVPILAAALLLGGVLLVGRLTRDQVRTLDRSCITFAEIDCDVPPGMRREDFLTEVQYLASLPDRVELLEDGLAEKLARAFAEHPRVRKVEWVEVLPERRIRVQLAFR